MAKTRTFSQSVPHLNDATIEPIDGLDRKIRVKRQVERLRRLASSGLVCLLINPIYFAYRIACCLHCSLYLCSVDVMIVWIFLGLELSLACKSSLINIADLMSVTLIQGHSPKFPGAYRTCLIAQKDQNQTVALLDRRTGSHGGYPNSLLR